MVIEYNKLIYFAYLNEAELTRGEEMEEVSNDKWISLDEAADYLDIKPVTLRGWIRNEKKGLPAQKIGKQWKFKKTELDEWVKSGKSAD